MNLAKVVSKLSPLLGNTPFLEIKNLVKQYDNFTALNNVSFKINKKEIVVLIGANGAGKSTLINILAGSLKETFEIILE